MNRRSFLQGLAAIFIAPKLPALPAKMGLAAWLPTAAGTFYGRAASSASATAILKALWPQERIDAMVYEKDFMATVIKSMKPK